MSDIDIDAAMYDIILQERQRRQLDSDADLAKELGIFPKHISAWKNGKFTRLDRVLLRLVLNAACVPTPATDHPYPPS